MSRLARWQSLIVPVGIIAGVLVMIAPLPAAVLDVLLAANLAVAVMVLLTALSVKTPLEFGVFPSLLLATTLTRLVLNVASTRLILTQAGAQAADSPDPNRSPSEGTGDARVAEPPPSRPVHGKIKPHFEVRW